MITYLDACVIVPMLVQDDHSARVDQWLKTRPATAYSLWTLAEVSSALSHQVRTSRLSEETRLAVEMELEHRFDPSSPSASVLAEDFLVARELLIANASLRTPDALHLAIARREGMALATLDRTLAEAAPFAGVDLAAL